MAFLTTNLSGLSAGVRGRVIKNLQHEDRAQYVLGTLEQLRMKRAVDAVVQPGTTKAELGPMQAVISQDQAARARALYGQLCFMDPEFVPWLLKQHDEMRVKQVGARVQIQSGWQGQRKSEGLRAR